MKSKHEIEEQIKKIESDSRYSYPAANVNINAVLAIIQVDMRAEVRALKWALKDA